MDIRLLNAVILAVDFASLLDWYVQTLGLTPVQREGDADGYAYRELAFGKSHVLGIAQAGQMGVTPTSPRRNTAIPQLYVTDVGFLLEKVAANGGTVLFGPSYDEAFGGYTYGGFTDPEGNQIWVVDLEGTAL